MGVGSKPLHCLTLIYHVLFLLLSLGVLVVSSVSLANLQSYESFLSGSPSKSSDADASVWKDPCLGSHTWKCSLNIMGAPSLLIASSTFSMFIGAFGFYSTLKRNVHFLRALIFLMVIVLAMDFSSGTWAFVVRSRSKVYVRSMLFRNLEDYGHGAKSEPGLNLFMKKNLTAKVKTHPWDILQHELHCCGVDGPGDFTPFGAVPSSCCLPAIVDVPPDKEDEKKNKKSKTSAKKPTATISCASIMQNGCIDSLDDYVRKWLAWVGIFGISAAFIKVVGTTVVATLTLTIKKDLQRVYQ